MIWLLANWRTLAAGIAVAAMLGWGSLGWWKYTSEKEARAGERQAAAEFALRAEKTARDKDNANAELASKLEAEHTGRMADALAGRDDFERELAQRLRAARSACRGIVPVAAGGASQPAPTAAVSDDGHRQVAAGLRIRDGVKELQSVAAECVSWAAGIGR